MSSSHRVAAAVLVVLGALVGGCAAQADETDSSSSAATEAQADEAAQAAYADKIATRYALAQLSDFTRLEAEDIPFENALADHTAMSLCPRYNPYLVVRAYRWETTMAASASDMTPTARRFVIVVAHDDINFATWHLAIYDERGVRVVNEVGGPNRPRRPVSSDRFDQYVSECDSVRY